MVNSWSKSTWVILTKKKSSATLDRFWLHFVNKLAGLEAKLAGIGIQVGGMLRPSWDMLESF